MGKKVIEQLEKGYQREETPEFESGDDVRISVRIKEGDKTRTQVFAGTVIARRGAGLGATFTVRKQSAGVWVERIFPLHSPNIEKIERIKRGKVRRNKLYYLRNIAGKSARIEERFGEAANASVTPAKAPAASAKAK